MSLQKKALTNNRKILFILAMFLVIICMVLMSKQTDATDMCIYHQQHNEECGYVAPVEGSSCQHEHSDECYQKELVCTQDHEHNDECYQEVLDCQHQHDETCGYREPVAGHECEHICSNCDTTLIRTASLEIKDDQILHVESKLIGNKTEDQVYYYIQFDRDLLVDLDLSLQDKKYTIQTNDNQTLVLEPIYISNDDDNVYLKYQQDYHSTISFDLPFKNTITEAMAITYASSFDETNHTSMATIPSKTVQTKLSETITYAASDNYNAVVLADGAETASFDFGPFISSTSVKELENGVWVNTDGKVTDGQSIYLTMEYNIPDGYITVDNKDMYYQLPDGINVMTEYNGLVYKKDGIAVGTYKITTDGLISISFYEGFANGDKFSGKLEFGAIADIDESKEESKDIYFGNTKFTVEVNKTEETSDLNIAKTHEEANGPNENGEYTVKYSIKVSSTKGSEGTVTIKDELKNSNMTLNSDSIIVKKGDSTISNPSITYSNDNQTFEIKNLEQLNAGESYTVEYTVTAKPDSNGYLNLSNQGSATDGKHWPNSYDNYTVSQAKIAKSGYVNDKEEIVWTINLNDVQSSDNRVLLDKLPEGLTWKVNDNGQYCATLNYNGKAQEIVFTKTDNGFEYTLPNNIIGQCEIVYTTTITNKGQPGDPQQVYSNHAEYNGYNTSSDVSYRPISPVIKKLESKDNQYDSFDVSNTYNWYVELNIPNNQEEYIYTDVLTSNTQTNEIVHYFLNKDHMKLSILDDSGQTLDNIVSSILYIDNNNQEYKDFHDDKTITGFKIIFKDEIKNYSTIKISYSSYAEFKDDIDSYIRYTNTGSFVNHKTSYDENHRKLNGLEKYAGKWDGKTYYSGVDGNYGIENRFKADYTKDNIVLNYNETHGNLYYMILVNVSNEMSEDLVIEDYIPEGTSLNEEDNFKPYLGFYYEYSNYLHSYKYYGWQGCGVNEEHSLTESHLNYTMQDNKITFTIKKESAKHFDNNNYHTFAICYALKIDSDTFFSNNDDSVVFNNEANWKSYSSSSEQTIKKSYINKKATVDNNTINYSLVINPSGEDLLEGDGRLILEDQLSIDNKSDNDMVLFLNETLKIRSYDAINESPGDELPNTIYSYSYDQSNYMLTISLPDSMPLYVEYQYYIKGNSNSLKLTNSAMLNGEISKSDSTESEWNKQHSSAEVWRDKLEFIKVDKDNYNITLQGAEFNIYDSSNQKVNSDVFVTDSDGLITLDFSDNLNLTKNSIYYLKEEKSPNGYLSNNSKTYFVICDDNTTLETIKNNLSYTITSLNISVDDIHFVASSGGKIYIENTQNSLHAKKTWINSDGSLYSGLKPDIQLELYQSKFKFVKEKEPSHTVKIHWTVPSWNGQETSNYEINDVADASEFSFKISNYGDVNSLNEQITCLLNDQRICPDSSLTYSIGQITEDIDLYFTITWQMGYNSFLPTYSEAKEYTVKKPDGDAKHIATVNMSENGTNCDFIEVIDEANFHIVNNNNYEVEWENLPIQSDDGTSYIYFIKEVQIDEFKSTIANNNIETGTISITNTKDKVLETLPETGGFGTLSIILSGLTMICFSLLCFLKKKLNYRKVGEHK